MPKSLPAHTPARPKAPIAYRGSEDLDQSKYNEQIASCLLVLSGAPTANYSVVDISIGTGPTKVSHRLGRPWVGWTLIDRLGTGTIRRVDPGAGQDPEDLSTHFYLQSSATETVRILIF